MNKEKKKVCLVTLSLANGGAEKSTALLSEMLQTKGYDVHIVTLMDEIVYKYSGKLFNIGKKKTQNEDIIHRLLRFNTFRNYLIKNNFDFIIDNRTHQLPLRELFYMYYIYRGFEVIYVVRSSNLDYYFPKSDFVSNLIIKRANKIIAVSNSVKKEIQLRFSHAKVNTIYNPAPTLNQIISSTDEKDYIVFLGRLEDDVKNISLLINSYHKSEICNKYKLKIYGDGKDKLKIEKLINVLKLNNSVQLYPFTTDIFKVISNAKFLALTSNYEGFPRCLIESLSIGTPVVSVNCPGVDEIVTHEYNGLLVSNYNPSALAEAFNKMYLDNDLYLKCKSNAISSVAHLHPDIISDQWDRILNQHV